jgi:pimeloyl-ACP methyl ester carboxylesterase
MSIAIIKNLNVSYITIGEGKPLLILHGWGSKAENWSQVAQILSTKGYKSYIPDLPGFGESQKPDFAWGLGEYCSFINEFVKVLNLNNFNLLGHSFGGALAAKYVLKFPGKTNKLFLVGAACIRERSFKKNLFRILKVLKVVPFAKKFFYKFIAKSDYPQTEGIMREIYLKVIKEDLSGELGKINIPTVIIWGKKDDITPLRQGKKINSKIKDSKLIVIPNQGHGLQLTAPEELCSCF